MNEIEKLKAIIEDIENEKLYGCHLNAVEGEEDIIISAIEKQIPKKAVNEDDDCNVFDCPSCGHTIIYLDDKTVHKYCLICGQALDWEDEDE